MRKNAIEAEGPNGRERLLYAAIRLFGRDGFDSTSVRTVAEEAGVSWGLVRFYFGSKDGLRDAAEEHVVRVYLDRAVAGASAAGSGIEELTEEAEASADLPLIAQFLRRAIIEERPIALDFLGRLVSSGGDLPDQLHSEFPRESWLADPIRNVATRLGYLLLAPQFAALLGRDVFSVEELKLRNRQNFRMYGLIRAGLEAEPGK